VLFRLCQGLGISGSGPAFSLAVGFDGVPSTQRWQALRGPDVLAHHNAELATSPSKSAACAIRDPAYPAAWQCGSLYQNASRDPRPSAVSLAVRNQNRFGNPRFLQIECLQEELFCKKLQNRRNLSPRREYASARMALGGAPFVVIRQEELR
jgi:hypothetical protein